MFEFWQAMPTAHHRSSGLSKFPLIKSLSLSPRQNQPESEMDIETVDQICKSLPHVEEEIKWKSDLVYMIARKMFCVVDLEAIPTSVAFKVPVEDFEELSTAPNFKPAPYFAQHKWVTVVDFNKISAVALGRRITTSYELVRGRLGKRVLEGLE